MKLKTAYKHQTAAHHLLDKLPRAVLVDVVIYLLSRDDLRAVTWARVLAAVEDVADWHEVELPKPPKPEMVCSGGSCRVVRLEP